MSFKHHLAIDVIDAACPTILKLVDLSVYSTSLAFDCPRLDITLPGFTHPVYITENLTKGFMINVNGKLLGLQNEQDNVLVNLPDGLYKIRYSISPNETKYVEYYHLRTTSIMNEYFREVCKVQLEPCEPSGEQHKKMHELRYIKMFIDAAKAKTEYCHAPVQGVEMLVYAEKLLSKYLSGTCLTCK